MIRWARRGRDLTSLHSVCLEGERMGGKAGELTDGEDPAQREREAGQQVGPERVFRAELFVDSGWPSAR